MREYRGVRGEASWDWLWFVGVEVCMNVEGSTSGMVLDVLSTLMHRNLCPIDKPCGQLWTGRQRANGWTLLDGCMCSPR